MVEEQNALSEEAISEDNQEVAGAEVAEEGNAGGEQVEMEAEAQISDSDPLSVKKRLGMQAKKHRREMRALHDRISEMQNGMNSGNANPNQQGYQDAQQQQGQPDMANMSEQDKIQYAVRTALGMQAQEKRQAEEADKMAHVQKQYQRLGNEFDRASDKYEDFDDVVRSDDTPFTPHLRDALLLVENPAEVAYRLGKNRDELERITKLHPLDQAREVNKLSFSLMGNGGAAPAATRSTPLGGVRANPAGASGAITDKTPPSVIRARMKAGAWK